MENDERKGSRIHSRYQPAGMHDMKPVVDQRPLKAMKIVDARVLMAGCCSIPHGKQRGITRKAMDILSPLEGAWVWAILLTHNAFNFAQRTVLMVLQPGCDLHLDPLNMLDPVTHESAAEHRYVSAGHD